MYLKSLEVQGFKSFPDKTVIRFGGDITAIVGPNGSGKSNISDAILWVLGEQSTKALRGAKMEDVIFGGTQKRAAVGFAEATLTLDNADRAIGYDADEVMITRRYYRSGDSEYYINRQSARLRDINELFMDTGLGKEGYANIGQGRIDEILALKSGDRREIFEEAAGISKYRHRKEETERKLMHTEDNLLRIGDKISELELQLEPLKQQSEKAIKYLEYRDELQGVEVAVWLDRLEKLSAEAKKADEDYVSASFVLQQAHEDLNKLYDRSEDLGEALRVRDEELEDARVRISMQEGAYQQLSGQIAVLQSNIENNDGNLARIGQELQGTDDRSGGIGAQLEQTEQRIGEIGALLEEKNREIEKLRETLAEMVGNAQGITRQFLQLRTKESSLTADVAAKEADARSLEGGLSEYGNRKEELEADLRSGEERKQQAQRELDDCRSQLKEAAEEVTAAGNAISGYNLRQQTRAKRRDALDGELRTVTAQLDGVQAKKRVFQAMERDLENYQKSVRCVMQEASRGSLRNIYGPVSKLIRTEDEYTTAIEIALGGALQQIVVGSEQDAKAAIAFLKRTGGGRATFLPVSVIRGRTLSENGLERCNGYVGIASELVSCEKTYRQIVENLLGRTVIVRDIDAAIAIARKYDNRFKLVTLDGQVVNPGGSMTGGSVNKETGLLSRANELERLQKQEETLSGRKAELETDLGEAQRQVDQVQFQIAAASDQLRQAEDQVLRLEGHEKQYEVMLEAICDAMAAARREYDSLDSREKSDRERYVTLTTQVKLYTGELEKIRTEIAALESTQTEANEQSARITDQMTRLKTEVSALEAEASTARLHCKDLEDLRIAIEGDRTQKTQLMESIRRETEQLREQIGQLQEKQAENEKETENMRRQRDEILAKRAQAEADRTKAEREAQEKNKDILNMERACALLENKKETTAIEERNTVDKLWDTYGLTPGTAQEKRGEIESVAAGNRRIAELKRKISNLGTPNLGAIEEYARVNERYSYLSGQRDDVLTSKKELETIIRQITEEMTTIFVTEFDKINTYFGQTFEEMFGGGKGQLVLEDPEDPLGCGIEIKAQPPGKQLKTITLLSGGEKAFVAIALYFAILKVRPTPFCMLDEIDAALDDRNVERFVSYLHNLSEKTQFIVITHRRGTMEASNVLYGVTMQEQGVSKLLRLDLDQMEEYLGIME